LLVNLDGRLKPGFFVQAYSQRQGGKDNFSFQERAWNYRLRRLQSISGERQSRIRETDSAAGQTEDERGRRFEVAEGLKPGIAWPLLFRRFARRATVEEKSKQERRRLSSAHSV